MAIQQQDRTEEVYRRGIVVASNVPRETYLEFCDGEPKVSVKYRLIDGKVVAHDLPLDPHSRVQGVLTGEMYTWNRRELWVMGETDITVNTRDVYRPDVCIRPSQRRQPPQRQAANPSGNPYPTMVIEIGNTESLNSLHELATGYFSPRTNIQMYLAIKLFPRRRDRTFALLALFYRRDQPNPTVPCIAKSFGTATLHISTTRFLLNIPNFPANSLTGVGRGQVACDGPNLADYQLAIPTNLLFNDVPTAVPNGTPNNFFIDLWDIQSAYSGVLRP
ncbi:2643_t:CDS:1 [Paraglomus occultum]|uniref:2643_t:CDS:1 n=1 Tax=Paraglomus occultum TaxID=144539 RepID=A0A9N9B154_9GLOM|nr:2643_t:CDS:1 [Paraglomus occultum]